MARSKSYRLGPTKGIAVGHRQVTWDIENQCPLVGIREQKQPKKGLWITECRGFVLLFWNGRFMLGSTYEEEDKERFMIALKIMANPRDRVSFLVMIDNKLAQEEDTVYV